MELLEQFNLVKDELRKGNYTVNNFKNVKINKNLSLHIESLNYMIYKWNEDNNEDNDDLFKYIIIPCNLYINLSSITFKEFFYFLMKAKDKDNENFDLIINK